MSDLYLDSHRSASRWVKRLCHTIIQTTAAISSGTVCGGWVRRRGRLVIFGDQSMCLLFGRENHRTWIPLPHEQGSGHFAIGSAASAWSTLIGHATAHTTPEDESPLDGCGSLDSYASTTFQSVLSCSFLFQQASPQGTVAQGSCSLLTCAGTISPTYTTASRPVSKRHWRVSLGPAASFLASLAHEAVV